MTAGNRQHIARKGDIVKVETEGVYKNAAIFFAGVILSGCVAWFVGPKNAVTQEELRQQMPGLIVQYSSYTQDAKVLQDQLSSVRSEQTHQNANIEQLQRNIQEIQINVARVGEKLGVEAHPGMSGAK